MKRLLFLPVWLLILVSCKEVGPAIEFGKKSADTAFMAPVETPQQRIVLIEEFTGVTCPQCPAGHVVLKAIEDENPGQVAIIGIQFFGPPQSTPVNQPGISTIHDNRTQVGTSLCNGIYGTNNSLPTAGIDRVSQNGSLITGRKDWLSLVNTRKIVHTDANVIVTSTYDSSKKQAIIKVHVAYTSPVAKNQLLTVALIENEVIDAQEYTQLDIPPVVQDYHHQHVLRDILTIPTGNTILSSMPTKGAGQVYERTFVYTLPTAVLNPNNCRIVAYVSNANGADKEVIQAAEAPLNP